MNMNKISECNSKTGEIPKVQDNNAIKALAPYYWSWYGSIFPSRNQLERIIPDVTVKEKH
jgi:hypothetical protein